MTAILKRLLIRQPGLGFSATFAQLDGMP